MPQMYLRQSPEKEMRNTILISLFLMLLPVSVSAQFYTITRNTEILPTERRKESYNRAGKDVTEGKKNKMMVKDTLTVRSDNHKESEGNSQNSDRKASLKREQQKNVDDIIKVENQLPELTIPNLYKEIIRNGILYPKIVLAQAILETGWFRSSVCRNKHNLFGLTNPRTGKYYEFNHWTESVRAYYTKVQYKYKGGNYLLWLDEIGYAEDLNYISSLIRILKMFDEIINI
jgi:flagellum-specific peptidoglycan hydrolase FlgJ